MPKGDTAEERKHKLTCREARYEERDLVIRGVRLCRGRSKLARDQIVHVIASQPFLQLASLSEFVPASRESIWALGLHAGTTGDFLTATHVLVPQIEHSIRTLLVRSGKVPVVWTRQGYEELPDLNAVLREPQTEKLLGKDLVFAMTAVFVNRFGGNLRNELAHGLLETGAFYSETAVYAWWLLLKCVVAFGRLNQDQD
jgi:Domain of unknown function (DUF4209)